MQDKNKQNKDKFKIEPTIIPQFLYKYKSWITKKDKSILKEQNVWFASPATLNDPYDCKITFNYELIPIEEYRNYFTQKIRENIPLIDDESIIAQVNEILRQVSFSLKDNKFMSEERDKTNKRFEKHYGILSLSNCYDKMLMWSHYSNLHKGICIEYDGNKITKDIFELKNVDNGCNINFFNINYVKELPIIIPTLDPNNNVEFFIQNLRTKSIKWEYEEEYRFVSIKKTNFPHKISKGAFKRVFLGCKISENDEKEIIDVVSRELPNTEIWKAEKSFDESKLEFNQLK